MPMAAVYAAAALMKKPPTLGEGDREAVEGVLVFEVCQFIVLS